MKNTNSIVRKYALTIKNLKKFYFRINIYRLVRAKTPRVWHPGFCPGCQTPCLWCLGKFAGFGWETRGKNRCFTPLGSLLPHEKGVNMVKLGQVGAQNLCSLVRFLSRNTWLLSRGLLTSKSVLLIIWCRWKCICWPHFFLLHTWSSKLDASGRWIC